MAKRASSRTMGAAVAVAVGLCLSAGPVWAYVDPGTGGAVFSNLVPILAALGVLLLATVRHVRLFAGMALRAAWRHRVWCLLALAACGAVLIYLLVR